jgi:glutamine amidotransferase PdxT
VAARQAPLLVRAFHPELADDPRLHCFFLAVCRPAHGSGQEDGVPVLA